MSQAGLIDIESANPQIPTLFIADVGSAIPIDNTLELLGEVIPNAGVPFQSVASGNTVTYQVQFASAAAASDPTAVGLASFNSADFVVDADGFVSVSATAGATTLGVDASTPPGTDPVEPDGLGTIDITGGQVAAGTTVNAIQTNSIAANQLIIQIQRSSAQATTTIGANGVAHFDSAAFDVDANGWVQLNGGGIAATAFDVQANTVPGTDPVVPTSAGVVTVNGAAVANHSVVIETRSRAANTYNVEVQYATSAAATDATKSGVAHFNSTQFSVDANGFVQLSGGGLAIDSFIPDSGTNPVVPDGNGAVTMTGSGSTTTVGGTNTLIFQLTGLTNHAVLVGAGTTTITKVGPSATVGAPLLSAGAAADPAFSTTFTIVDSTGTATLTSSQSGTGVGLNIINSSNTASSIAYQAIQSGGTTALGAYTNWNTAGSASANFSSGVLATDGNWYLHQSSGAFGSNPIIKAFQAGQVVMPLQPFFQAYNNTTRSNETGDGTTYTVICNKEVEDNESNYDTTTGVFTAPVAGRYLFFAAVLQTNLGAGHNLSTMNFVRSGNGIQYGNINSGVVRTANAGESNTYSMTGTMIYHLNASDTVGLSTYAGGSTKTVGVFAGSANTFFGGMLIS